MKTADLPTQSGSALYTFCGYQVLFSTGNP